MHIVSSQGALTIESCLNIRKLGILTTSDIQFYLLYFFDNNDSSITIIDSYTLDGNNSANINEEICISSRTLDLEISWFPEPELKITFVVSISEGEFFNSTLFPTLENINVTSLYISEGV